MQEIAYPFSFQRLDIEKFNENWEHKEVCPICRLRPMDENSDACEHCLQRRIKRAEEWLNLPKKTIWLDEVSDHNDRVSLLTGSFIIDKWLDGSFVKTMAIKTNPPEPKHPSPARIRRIWETTEIFISQTIKKVIAEKLSSQFSLRNKRIKFKITPNPDIITGATCEVDIDGTRIFPVCIDRQEGVFLTTCNLEILSKLGKTIDQIADNINNKNIKIKMEDSGVWVDKKNNNFYQIKEANPADGNFQDYLPYIEIFTFPNQFMYLLPAYESLDIAKEIYKEYEKHFAKVRDRLPFHIGLIGFHRRTTLYVAMDAAKRLLETFENETKKVNAKVKNIILTNNKEYELELESPNYSSNLFKWKFSCATGDTQVDDDWHPYIRIEGDDTKSRKLCFDYTGNKNYVVHIKDLKINDTIFIEPSFFELFFIERSADRFLIGTNLKPIHYIVQLPELWKDIQKIVKEKNLGISQIYAFWQEVKKRYEGCKCDPVWENFVRASLINILKLSPEKDGKLFNKFFQATKDGLLDICLYWNLGVRKIKPEKKEVNQ